MQGVGVPSSLNLRIPFWANTKGAKAVINNRNLPLPAPGMEMACKSSFSFLNPTNRNSSPIFNILDSGNYLSVTRKWNPADRLFIQLPINLWTEAIKGFLIRNLTYITIKFLFFVNVCMMFND